MAAAPHNANPALARLPEALAHHQAGRLEAADRIYAQLRRTAPTTFDVWHLGGLAQYQLGRLDEAAATLTRATQLMPTSAVCLMRLGVVHLARNSLAAAESCLKRALERDPQQVEAWENLTTLYLRKGTLPEAHAAALKATRLRPDLAALHDRLAAVTCDWQGFARALPLLEETTRRWPDFASGWKNYGLALSTLHEPEAALAAFDKALTVEPTMLTALHGRGLALQEAFRIPEAIAAYDAVLQLDPNFAEAESGRLLCLNYLEEVTPELLFTAHQAFGQRYNGAGAPTMRAASALARPLRLAILSPDLRRHAVATFLEPLLTNLQPQDFEVWLYHDHAVVDDMSERLRARAARWRHVAGQHSGALENILRADAPDVLIDLAGHTGSCRLPLLARRLAPLQITYLGYPNTTGVTTIDYRFTDALADPPGLTDSYYTERLVRLGDCAWAYQPPSEAPAVAPLQVGTPNADGIPQGVAFGSFNNPAKLSDGTLRRWAAVLVAVPGSRLVLKGHGLDTAVRQDALRARAAAQGLPPERIEFIGRTQAKAAHLDLYRRVDITLDPYPYHGTTTTVEALWMGRPVITLAGHEHRSRVGVSLLTAAGHPEWIATTDQDYIHIATELARDVAKLRQVSAGLRDDLRGGLLLDHAAHARRFTLAVQSCWAERCTAL